MNPGLAYRLRDSSVSGWAWRSQTGLSIFWARAFSGSARQLVASPRDRGGRGLTFSRAAAHARSMLRARQATPIEDLEPTLASAGHPVPARPDLDESARVALGGEPSALRAFLTQAAPIVRRVCRGVMGGTNPELEDAIQDSLIDLARALPQFRFEGSVAHYVAKIAMRRAISARRRARERSKQQETLGSLREFSSLLDGSQETRADLVRKLLDALNEEQTKALLLRIMIGHSIDEIAALTGVSVNTVKTRLRLAKNRLRGWLVRSGEVRRGDGSGHGSGDGGGHE